MATKKQEISQEEKISHAKLLIELYLNGKLTLWDLNKRLSSEKMRHTKIEKPGKLIFVIRGEGIQDARLQF